MFLDYFGKVIYEHDESKQVHRVQVESLSNVTEINSVDVHVDSFFKYKSLHENNGAEFIIFPFRPEHCT